VGIFKVLRVLRQKSRKIDKVKDKCGNNILIRSIPETFREELYILLVQYLTDLSDPFSRTFYCKLENVGEPTTEIYTYKLI
jgi:hypothetical protein